VPTANQVVPDLLEKLHIDPVSSGVCHGDWVAEPEGSELVSYSPVTGEPLARVRMAGPADYQAVIARAADSFLDWRMVPAPRRGEIVREIGNELRACKQDLGALVSLEMGKSCPKHWAKFRR
jgi:aldehyde dehydrogenase (NAD+)